jgi:hypothetical protein
MMLVTNHILVKPGEAKTRVSAVSGRALASVLAVAAGLADARCLDAVGAALSLKK